MLDQDRTGKLPRDARMPVQAVLIDITYSAHRQVHAIFPTARKSKFLVRFWLCFLLVLGIDGGILFPRGGFPLCSSDDPFVQTSRERVLFDAFARHRKRSVLQIRANTVKLVASLLFLVRLT